MTAQIRSVLSSSIGNIIEWYDFGLFAMYSSVFSQLFFPTKNPHAALIGTFMIFAIGFLCRPLGAIFFGILGDTKGRVTTLRLSILMISLPTLLIGCLPTFESVGIIAPILLMLIRAWQGISIGGEYSGNIIYLAETAPNAYRATITSLASVGANLGILLATVVGALTHFYFSDALFNSWGWRIPYLLSGIVSLIIYFVRMQMVESKVYERLKQEHKLARNPVKIVFKDNLPQLFRTIGLVCMGTTFYYFSFIFIPVFFFKNQFSFVEISVGMSLILTPMLFLTPLAGRLCDAVGRRKMLLFNAFFVMLIVIPGFYFIQSHYLPAICLTLSIFVIASSLEQGTTSIAVVENFPPTARYTGLSLGYNLGNGILGGTVPLVSEYLVRETHFTLAPAIYIALCAAVTGIVVVFFVKETRGKALC
jgi:MHS family proline/betaine transporter-like MFS transporter